MKRYIRSSIRPESLSGNDMIATLDNMEVGTPLLIDVGTGTYEQVIYVGVGEVQSQTTYEFFDGSALSGTFATTKRFIRNNPDRVSIILNDNDPVEVADLLDQLHSRG